MDYQNKPDEAIEILKANGADTLAAIRAALAQRDEALAALETEGDLARKATAAAYATPPRRAWYSLLFCPRLPIAIFLIAAGSLTAQVPRRDTTCVPPAPIELEPHWEVSNGTVRLRYVPKGRVPMRQLPRKKAAEWLRHEPIRLRLN